MKSGVDCLKLQAMYGVSRFKSHWVEIYSDIAGDRAWAAAIMEIHEAAHPLALAIRSKVSKL